MTAAVELPEGWMGKTSRRWLKGRARRHRRIIEVGSWLGRSTKVLAAHTRGKVWAVDHWEGTPHDPEQHQLYAEDLARGDLYAQFTANLAAEIARGKVIPVRMDSAAAAVFLLERYGLGAFDMVFIDGDHSYEGCLADIRNYRPLIKPGGLVCGHDYHWDGVARAVAESFALSDVSLGPKSLWSVTV